MYGNKGSVGLENQQIIKGGEDISRAKWYVGKVDREDCDKAVQAAGYGDFLVRLNSKGDKYVVCVNDHGQAQNMLVEIIMEGKKKGQVKFSGKTYKSIMDLLNRFREEPIKGTSGREYILKESASDCDWYVGGMNREDCEKLVLAGGKSDYVVRLARNKIQYVLVVNEGKGKILNAGIDIGTTGKKTNKFTVKKKTYDTVGEAIDDLKDTAMIASDGSKIYLRNVATASTFYAGMMPRAECEDFVKAAGHGDYLVRQKSDGKSYVLVVNADGDVLNMVIKRDAEGTFEGQDTLEGLVRLYKKKKLKTKGGGNVKLAKPARMTQAADIRAEINFGLQEVDDEDEFGFGESEDESDEEEEDDGVPPKPKFVPAKYVAIDAIDEDGFTCAKNDGMFVVKDKGDKWQVVCKGAPHEVRKELVKKDDGSKPTVEYDTDDTVGSDDDAEVSDDEDEDADEDEGTGGGDDDDDDDEGGGGGDDDEGGGDDDDEEDEDEDEGGFGDGDEDEDEEEDD